MGNLRTAINNGINTVIDIANCMYHTCRIGNCRKIIPCISKRCHSNFATTIILLRDRSKLSVGVINHILIIIVISNICQESIVIKSVGIILHIGHNVCSVISRYHLQAKAIFIIVNRFRIVRIILKIVRCTISIGILHILNCAHSNRLHLLNHIQRPARTQTHRQTHFLCWIAFRFFILGKVVGIVY